MNQLLVVPALRVSADTGTYQPILASIDLIDYLFRIDTRLNSVPLVHVKHSGIHPCLGGIHELGSFPVR